MTNKFLIISALCFSLFKLEAQEQVTIQFDKVEKQGIKPGASAANLCWLMDSDEERHNKHQSMRSAFTEMGAGALRFPYGHLADNYFWHTPPYDDVEGGLRPKVASFKRPPANWDWAVNKDGSFIKDMDFDEFMKLCNEENIAPLVVVNILSHKYPDGPSIETLAESAAEWVRYSKNKGYKVAYWQIGNEIDHHPKTITLKEFIEGYKTIASAMKAVDPSVKIGPGILGKQHYFTALYNAAPELVDFTSCHQYMWKFVDNNKNYDLWSKVNMSYIENVEKMQRAVSNTADKDMEILITETGVTPSGKGLGDINNLYKSLWWFEVLMSELKIPNVAYSFFWGSHSPWKGLADDEKDDVGVLFRADDNSRKPIAEVSKIVNEHLLDNFVNATATSDALRVYAMSDNNGDEAVVLIMNKRKEDMPIKLALNALSKELSKMQVTTLTGKNPFAREVKIKEEKAVSLKKAGDNIMVPGVSLTAIRLIP